MRREQMARCRQAMAELDSVCGLMAAAREEDVAACGPPLERAAEALRALAEGGGPVWPGLRQPVEDLRRKLRLAARLANAGAAWAEQRLEILSGCAGGGYTAEGRTAEPAGPTRLAVKG